MSDIEIMFFLLKTFLRCSSDPEFPWELLMLTRVKTPMRNQIGMRTPFLHPLLPWLHPVLLDQSTIPHTLVHFKLLKIPSPKFLGEVDVRFPPISLFSCPRIIKPFLCCSPHCLIVLTSHETSQWCFCFDGRNWNNNNNSKYIYIHTQNFLKFFLLPIC